MSLPLPNHRTRSTRLADCGPGRGEGGEDRGSRITLYLRKSLRDCGVVAADTAPARRGPVLQPGPLGVSWAERRGLKHRATAGRLRLIPEVSP